MCNISASKRTFHMVYDTWCLSHTISVTRDWEIGEGCLHRGEQRQVDASSTVYIRKEPQFEARYEIQSRKAW